jgi:hypothetical protein
LLHCPASSARERMATSRPGHFCAPIRRWLAAHRARSSRSSARCPSQRWHEAGWPRTYVAVSDLFHLANGLSIGLGRFLWAYSGASSVRLVRERLSARSAAGRPTKRRALRRTRDTQTAQPAGRLPQWLRRSHQPPQTRVRTTPITATSTSRRQNLVGGGAWLQPGHARHPRDHAFGVAMS